MTTELDDLKAALQRCRIWHRELRPSGGIVCLQIRDEMHRMVLAFDATTRRCLPVKPIVGRKP